MSETIFKTLSKEEMLFRMKQQDEWSLQDIILFVYGYEHQGFDWNAPANDFPYRQYSSALQATNHIDPKRFLAFTKKAESTDSELVRVKKGPFIQWAAKEWPNEPKVQATFKLWKQYKTANKTIAPSLQSSEARIKNYGDAVQISQFLEHCKSTPPEKFKVNKTAIAEMARKHFADLDFQVSSFRRYIKKMSIEDLKSHLPK